MDEYELLEELEKLTDINHQLANRIAKLKKAKTLTDEEIIKTMKELKGNFWEGNFMVDFARAILRKAQEK